MRVYLKINKIKECFQISQLCTYAHTLQNREIAWGNGRDFTYHWVIIKNQEVNLEIISTFLLN